MARFVNMTKNVWIRRHGMERVEDYNNYELVDDITVVLNDDEFKKTNYKEILDIKTDDNA